MSGNRKQASPTLDQLLNWLTVEVSSGRSHISIVKALRRAERAGILRVAPQFFELTIGAHADATTLCINRLFDHRRGTMSLYSLLIVVRNHAGEFGSASAREVRMVVSESTAQIQSLETKLRALRTRRHKTLAHNDPNPLVDPEEYIRDGRVSYGELDELFDQADSIINKLRQLYFGKRLVLEDPVAKDCEALLELLARAAKRTEEQNGRRFDK
jgi:hypothetical protein